MGASWADKLRVALAHDQMSALQDTVSNINRSLHPPFCALTARILSLQAPLKMPSCKAALTPQHFDAELAVKLSRSCLHPNSPLKQNTLSSLRTHASIHAFMQAYWDVHDVYVLSHTHIPGTTMYLMPCSSVQDED